MNDPTNDELIAAAFVALRAYNFSEFMQEYTMFFSAPKSEVDSVIRYANIIKTLENLGYTQYKLQDLIMIGNCVQVLNKGTK